MSDLDALTDTPYLVEEDAGARKRADRALTAAAVIRAGATDAQRALIRHTHEALVEPFRIALRSDLVAESNRIEGYDWTSGEVRDLVRRYRADLADPTREFLQAVQADGHAYQALGLFAAHELAERLARAEGPMRETDIRSLHAVVTGDVYFAGRYKQSENKIAGTDQRRTAPWDVGRSMTQMCAWWSSTDAEPLLQAAVVHAWTSDIHPFEDGNGRISRLLANYALIKAGYPPLILRSQSDREEYYEALAKSDDGDILPLLELFVRSLRRTVKIMRSPGYIQQVVDDRLLASTADQHKIWVALADSFGQQLQTQIGILGGETKLMGFPALESYSLLCERDADGNSWFMKLGDGVDWNLLAWYGFESERMEDFVSDGPFPSIYFSLRDLATQAVHPYSRIGEADVCDLPNEVRLRPGAKRPVQLRWRHEMKDFTVVEAAKLVAGSVARLLQLA